MNEIIFFFFYNLSHQSIFFDKLVVFFAVYFPFIVVFLAGVFLLMHHEIFRAENIFQILMQKKKEILLVFVYGFLAYFLAVIFKYLFHTLRPFMALSDVSPLFHETGFAFPSGHAAFFGALSVAIFLAHKKAGLPAQTGYIFIFFAFLIGIARVIAGVHFPFDILGGVILGGLIAWLVAYFLKNI